MNNDQSLQRFIDAQETSYEIALTEIKQGRKRSHWMWYIFPQIAGLSNSTTSLFYGLKDANEATQYLQDKILGERLIDLCKALLSSQSNNAHEIFGSPDDLKLKSCMTLFSALPNTDPVFELVLQRFYNGAKDAKTLAIIGK